MISAIKKMFGIGPVVDYKELVKNGAQIIDVRSKEEYAAGHVSGSINIALGDLTNNLKKINKQNAIITCCASGMRSASAKAQLKSVGYSNVYNGGGWASLNQKLA